MIDDKQLWLGFAREISQLGSGRVVLRGEAPKSIRPCGEPRGRVDLVDQRPRYSRPNTRITCEGRAGWQWRTSSGALLCRALGPVADPRTLDIAGLDSYRARRISLVGLNPMLSYRGRPSSLACR